MKKILSLLLVCLAWQLSAQKIVVLYDNDVHCSVDGYAKMAALKKAEMKQNEYVAVVSCGDYVAGASLGAVSKGEYIVRIMNAVGYDYVTLGNHEFDYQVERTKAISQALTAQTLCCNFGTVEGDYPFAGYAINRYDDVDVAFVGVSTPSTPTSSTPTYFMDNEGHMKYTFCGDSLYERVQRMVDQARREGADVVVLLSHLGDDSPDHTSTELIAHTRGIDVVLDGHSHNTIPGREVKNKEGKTVLLASTGSHFENVGKLTIDMTDKMTLKNQLVALSSYNEIDTAVAMIVGGVKEEYDQMGRRVLGRSQVMLVAKDEKGLRLPRFQETNLGDLAADAMRRMMDAEIGWVNGGALRTNIKEGDITFNDLYSVFPFGNNISVIKVTGRQLLDNLELGVRFLGNDNGGFVQTSGLTYKIDTTQKSSVELDQNGILKSVGTSRRVHDVKVWNKKKGVYEAIDPDRSYTLASMNYVLVDHGNGYDFGTVKMVRKDVYTDMELMELFLKEIGGTVDSQYAHPGGRICFEKMQMEPGMGYWKGVLKEASLPANLRHVAVGEDSSTWVFYSPAQTDQAYWATKHSWKNDTLRMEVKSLGLKLTLGYDPSTGILRGYFKQGGMKALMCFLPSDTLWTFARPQTPMAPYPYEEETVVVNRKDANGKPVRLEGTLTYPRGEGPFPAVVLISGSGQQNRDEEIFGHKPFLVLADYLTRFEIAVLRYDDRGVGGSNGDVKSATTLDFADDAEAMFEALRKHKKIDKKRVGMVGHSEGGTIAPIVASRNKKVGAIVLMAGPGATGSEVLLEQNEDLFAGAGVSEELVKVRVDCMRSIYQMVDTAKNADRYQEYVNAIVKEKTQGLTKDQIDSIGMGGMALHQLSSQLAIPWWKTFLSLDASAYLKRVKCPVFALNGSLDCQVNPKNLIRIEKAIDKGYPNRYVVYPKLNHLFQSCESGLPSEYLFIEETINTEVIEDILFFLLDVWDYNPDRMNDYIPEEREWGHEAQD